MSSPSLWLIAAFLLAGLEMLTGTFYLIAVATGLLLGALTAFLGFSFSLQAIAASLLSLTTVIALHYWKKQQAPATPESSSDIGQNVLIVKWEGERRARVRYRGTLWDAELAAEAPTGLEHYFIIAMQGNVLTLHHQPMGHS
jgi:membrane protein implicated in regulation of membrane protease activity